MIKFNCLIHKETGTVIKYEDWKEKLKNDNVIVWKDEKLNGTWQYKPKNILFSDDFEIIYDSEFTTEELTDIYRGMNNKRLCHKISEMLNDRCQLEMKYGVEV